PGGPFFLATDGGDAAPGLPSFTDCNSVADRLALRQDVIKKLITGIDDDGAGGFFALVLDDVTPVLLRNDHLPVGQIGHQLLVTPTPASLCRRRQCPLHAAAEHQGDNCKDNRTHGCDFPLFRELVTPSSTYDSSVEFNVSLSSHPI